MSQTNRRTLMDMCPKQIQHLIYEMTNLDMDHISVSSTIKPESRTPRDSCRRSVIFFEISNNSNVIGKVKGAMDGTLGQIEFELPRSIFGPQFFEIGPYYKSYDKELRIEIIQTAIIRLFQYIFAYDDGKYRSIKLGRFVFRELRIDSDALRYYYDIYQIDTAKKNYLVLQKPKPHNLFDANLAEPCCVLMEKGINHYYKPSEMQPNGFVPVHRMWLFLSGLCRENGIELNDFLFRLKIKVLSYQAPKLDTLEFHRKCLIVQEEENGGYYILFDKPIRAICDISFDVSFKLSIRGQIITEGGFYFGNVEDDYKTKLHRFANLHHATSGFFVCSDEEYAAHSLTCLFSRYKSRDANGSISLTNQKFDTNMGRLEGTRIIRKSECSDEVIKFIHKLYA